MTEDLRSNARMSLPCAANMSEDKMFWLLFKLEDKTGFYCTGRTQGSLLHNWTV